MNGFRTRYLLVAWLLILALALSLGCTTKRDPAETRELCGNHSCGDLVMVTVDTSSDGFQYLDPAISPDGMRIAFTQSEKQSDADKQRAERYGAYAVEDAEARLSHIWMVELPDRPEAVEEALLQEPVEPAAQPALDRLAGGGLGKGGKVRVVPFGNKARRVLERYLEEGRPRFSRDGTGREVFLTYRGRPFSRKPRAWFIWWIMHRAM